MPVEELSADQKFFLVQLCQMASRMDHRELVRALMSAWEERFLMQRRYQVAAREAGVFFEVGPFYKLAPPETPEEFRDVLGYEPSAAEAQEYLRQLEEGVTMGVDMEEVVMNRLEPPFD